MDVGDDRYAERRGDRVGQIFPADARKVDHFGAPCVSFRLAWRDEEVTDDPQPYRGPRAELWELIER